jgi:NTP pyrophosphatase (non-canonical NTP hydrolase)
MLTRSNISDTIRSLVTSHTNYLEVVWGIEEFHKTYEVKKNIPLYVDLLAEEAYEFMEEIVKHGITPNLLKETADVIYILEGLLAMIEEDELDFDTYKLLDIIDMINRYVIPLATCVFTQNQIYMAFMETHRSNMSKLDKNGLVLRREDGKVLKGPNFSPADMTKLFHPYTFLNLFDRKED